MLFRVAVLAVVLASGSFAALDEVQAQPTRMSYQGSLVDGGVPIDGPVSLKFAIVSQGQTLWSNDGTSVGGSEPASAEVVVVDQGVFSLLLGDGSMTPLDVDGIDAAVDPAMRVWADTGSGFQLLGDQPLGSAPYALKSDAADRALADFDVSGALVTRTSTDGLGFKIEGHQSGNLNNQPALQMYDTAGNRKAIMSPNWFGNAGLVMFSDQGNSTIRFFPEKNNWDGGTIELLNDQGTRTIFLTAHNNDGEGKISTQVLTITGGSDLSENFDVLDEEPKPGMVVSIDPKTLGKLTLSRTAYDRRVAGVISGAGGVKPGMTMGQEGTVADGEHPVALTGRVYCLVDASHGVVEPGDLLTTSPTPGHAMRVDDFSRSPGATLGKAMSSLKEGQGLVLVLVALQ